jgi:hypothetical protein
LRLSDVLSHRTHNSPVQARDDTVARTVRMQVGLGFVKSHLGSRFQLRKALRLNSRAAESRLDSP